MNINKKLEILIHEWAAVSSFGFLKALGVSRESIVSRLDATLAYLNDAEYTEVFKYIPEKFDQLNPEDIRLHLKVIELHINTFVTDRTRNIITSSVAAAIEKVIIFGARIFKPNKEVKRERTFLKSGLHIPKAGYSYVQIMLDYLNEYIKQTPCEELVMLYTGVFELVINVLMKRKIGNGTEGTIISLMTVNASISTSIWDVMSNLAQMKQEPKVQNTLQILINDIESFRHASKETMANMVQLVTTLKGKWSLLTICSFVAKTFQNIHECSADRTNIQSYVSQLYPILYKYAIDNHTQEWLSSLLILMKISTDEDSAPTASKVVKTLNKVYTKLGGMAYFNLVGMFFDAIVGRSYAHDITRQFLKAWFDKNGYMEPQYKNDVDYWLQIASKMHFCAPTAFKDFVTPIIQTGESHPLFTKIVSVIHIITTISIENLEGITSILAPFVTNLINQPEIQQSMIKLITPLMSVLWKNESGMHGHITTLMSRLVKNNEITVLTQAASFFTDIMEHYPTGTLPLNLITTFATQFLKRTELDANPQQLVNAFTIYQSFFKSLLVYAKRGENVVDQESWNRVIRAMESRLICFSFFPSQKVTKIVEDLWELMTSDIPKTLSPNQLALKIPNITTISSKDLISVLKKEGIEQRFVAMLIFFVNVDNPKSDFCVRLAKFIFVITRPEYFVNNENIQVQGTSKMIQVLTNLPRTELCELVTMLPIEVWPMFVSQMMKMENLSTRLKFKFAYAMSCNRKFKNLVNTNEEIRNLFVSLVILFMNLPLPTNEEEQQADVLAAEFYASFIRANSENLNQHQEFQDPYTQLFAIIGRLNPDSITLPDISHVFAMLELVHAYVSNWKMTDEAIEALIDWTTFIALKTKGSVLLQLKCHELLQNLVEKNQEGLSVIISCCFRTSIFTTSHVAAAIASSNSDKLYMAILALGLCSRPNVVCRALASEIANSAFDGKFSPLCYMEYNFEEKLVEFYNQVLDNESKEFVFTLLSEVVGSTSLEGCSLPHFKFISNRFTNISDLSQIEKLLKLTSITDFTDLTPIKPLIPLWDSIFKQNTIKREEIFDLLIKKVDSVNNAKTLCAVCIAFQRSFLNNSKQTAQWLTSNLRIIQDPKMTFDGFVPTPLELACSACMSYIFTLETDVQRFNVCWMDKIQYILAWAIFLRFNPLYESYMIPPLLISVSHAAVPSSDLPLFVMRPSDCVAYNVVLPFRYTTEFTTSQMEMLVATLKKFSLLTAELFLDVCADKATSLTKYSADFWTLFSNFFQPRHSSAFLNNFMNAAQAGDLATVGLMMPIITGVVRQNARAEHIGGFVDVIIFVVTTTGNNNFLRLITKHLPGFVETVNKSSDSSTITSTLSWVIQEHGGEAAVIEGVLSTLQMADSLHSPYYTSSLTFLYEVARLLSISDTKYSLTSSVLLLFDSIRRIETNGLTLMISQDLLGLDPPKNYEELTELLKKNWSQSQITYVCSYLLAWAGASAIPVIPANAFTFLRIMTQNWTDAKYMQSISTLGTVISHMMVGATDEKIKLMLPDNTKILTSLVMNDKDLPDVVTLVSPLVERTKGKKSADPAGLPQILPKREHEATLVEVCEFIKSNILE
ncbi:hypothetical protein TVAG_424180 [Trichomonas vaginalis G3]|uniref:Uncharacterized protein n=1 Tax=Trichomonas vaginalis (strain ATCC PRA-98 / G3) TaxID=412133 RepID=A2E1Q8_TRIV3|nr:armadillo (ARM) repeat-containing protein family [Trichomonas vaginalis G3]EAY13387.1 hypothetical protein TVAG_424180 [Trichomonas vaginalis G3]KAI5528140.1 armadillo (ARM) repeat-containing protein family [Trichomonas vaginalis G3]|eukprot:XP_001325610.1 hypothetical protein [Trichomonas vaginalis G3]